MHITKSNIPFYTLGRKNCHVTISMYIRSKEAFLLYYESDDIEDEQIIYYSDKVNIIKRISKKMPSLKRSSKYA